MNLILWDKKSGFRLSNGKQLSKAEVFEEYPFTECTENVVLEILPSGNVGGIDDLLILRDVFRIDASLTSQQALDEIYQIKATPQPPQVDETAAKLDYLIMMNGGI